MKHTKFIVIPNEIEIKTQSNQHINKHKLARKNILNILKKEGYSIEDVFKAFHPGKSLPKKIQNKDTNIEISDRSHQHKFHNHNIETITPTDEQHIIEQFEKDENLIIANAQLKELNSKWYYLEPWDSNDGWRFRLRHRNTNIIMSSEAYSSKHSMQSTINRLSKEFNLNIIEDTTE